MSKIAKCLNQRIQGVIYDTPNVLEKYSTDRSVLKLHPHLVAVPERVSDICHIVSFVNQIASKGILSPITVRGKGNDKTGAAIGSGIIMSMEKLNKIFEIDIRQRLVRAQAGATLREINEALDTYDFCIPIDADPDQTIGGLIANAQGNSTMTRGKFLIDYVDQAEVVLSSGDVVSVDRVRRRGLNRKLELTSFEGEVYRRVAKLVEDYSANLIPEQHLSRALSGYPGLRAVAPDSKSFDLTPLLWGSQGSLAVLAEVILTFEVRPAPSSFIAAVYPDLESALSLIMNLPSELRRANIYDLSIIHGATSSGKICGIFDSLPDKGILILASIDAPYSWRGNRRLRHLAEGPFRHATQVLFSNPDTQPNFEELPSILSAYLNSSYPDLRIPIVDDAYVPKESLIDYMQGLQELSQKYGTHLALFGSLVPETYSVRPEFNLGTVPGRQFTMLFLRDYSRLIAKCGGTLAGGSPEGRFKAICTNSELEAHMAQAYTSLKDIMDPNNILNPGIKQQATLQSVVRQFRTSYNSGIIPS